MPRMSDAEKRKSHTRIIEAAAQLFRTKGIAATSVSDVMQAAGLTHGGFYRHFESKADLVSAAFAQAAAAVLKDLVAANTVSARRQASEAYIDRYLSLEHVKTPGAGCPFPSMGPELSRMDGDDAPPSETIGTTAKLLDGPGDTPTDTGLATLALLVGTVTLARLSQTDAGALQILEAGKEGVRRIRNPVP